VIDELLGAHSPDYAIRSIGKIKRIRRDALHRQNALAQRHRYGIQGTVKGGELSGHFAPIWRKAFLDNEMFEAGRSGLKKNEAAAIIEEVAYSRCCATEKAKRNQKIRPDNYPNDSNRRA